MFMSCVLIITNDFPKNLNKFKIAKIKNFNKYLPT